MPLADSGHEVDYIYVNGKQLLPRRSGPCTLAGAQEAKERGDDIRFLLAPEPENYAHTQEAIVDTRNRREAEGN
jgi:hypothetical protein